MKITVENFPKENGIKTLFYVSIKTDFMKSRNMEENLAEDRHIYIYIYI